MKKITFVVIVFLFISTIFNFSINQRSTYGAELKKAISISDIKSHTDVSDMDLSELDFRDKIDLLYSLTFNDATKWPSKERLPDGFDPIKLMEQGKNPGLGIDDLHKRGYLGSGVTVAIIDQHLIPNHEEYKYLNLHNIEIQTDFKRVSMHGPAVLSLLAGKDIGIVPNAEVYFFGVNGGTDNNEYEAKAFEKIVELNKTLPDNKKIRIVSMSHAPDNNLNVANANHLREAEKTARDSGIIVIDSSCDMATCGIKGLKDRDDYKNYQISPWEEERWEPGFIKNRVIVPADNRTTANGYGERPTEYTYWDNGGFSWGVPYIAGVITMGLQIDPTLTEEEAFDLLHESAHPYLNGDMINPEGFINLVKRNYDLKNSADYYYILYNSNKVSSNDFIAIKDYKDRMSVDGKIVLLKDVSKYKTAVEILDMLRQQSKAYKGKLLGVQIFGSSSDVPAFDIHFKVKTQVGIDDGGNFKSDFFYSNFDSDTKALNNDFSIYKAFEEKLRVSFIAEWSVSRLPLSAGEISAFINKYYDYRLQNKVNTAPYVSFNNPIFAQKIHSDDMGYFIKERLHKEFGYLKSSDYRLYSNIEGLYPVSTGDINDFDNLNLKSENEKGIANFIINSHGQETNIDKCVFIKSEDLPKYKDRIRLSTPLDWDNNLLELRIPFLNNENMNNILGKNYYTLTLWTCNNAFDLRNDNLVHAALKGKGIDVMGASSVISNNGVDDKAALEDMKNNNFYYFMYELFHYLSQGYSRSESFFNARRLYASEIMKHTDLLGGTNYGYNLHNVLSYHYLGLIDIPKGQCNGMIQLPENDSMPNKDFSSNNGPSSGHIGFVDNNRTYSNIQYDYVKAQDDYKVNFVGESIDSDNIYIKIEYSSPKDDNIQLFLQGGVPGLNEYKKGGTIKGENLIILNFKKDELKGYAAGIAINLGSGNFIFIYKNFIDSSYTEKSKYETSSAHISFVDNNLTYKDILYDFIKDEGDYSVNFVGESVDSDNVYIKIEYSSPKEDYLQLFLQGGEPGLNEYLDKGTQKGGNLIILNFKKNELKGYTAGLAINLGSKNFILIDKSYNYSLCSEKSENIETSSTKVNIEADPIVNIKAETAIKIDKLVLSSINIKLKKGQSVQLKSYITDGKRKWDVTTEAVWRSENLKISSVNKGKIKSLASGRTLVNVYYKGLKAKANITVNN